MHSQKDEVNFKIEAQSENWMRMTLWFWNILWTTMGLYVLYKVVFDLQDSGQILFFTAYLAFWLYFEWKGLEALIYKIRGFELITITRDQVSLEINYGWRKRRFSTERKNIRGIRKVTRERKSISEGFAKSFWTIANQQLEFYGSSEPIPFGMHLDREQTSRLLNQIKRKL
jgi:hypothetical protein